VLAKDNQIQLKTKNEALMGHIMVVASKVAKTLKLEDGYLLVVNIG